MRSTRSAPIRRRSCSTKPIFLIGRPCRLLVRSVSRFLCWVAPFQLAGLYLATGHLALILQIIKFKGFDSWTGGVQGIQVGAPEAPFGLPLNTDRWVYFFCLSWTVALLITARNLLRGRTGRAIVRSAIILWRRRRWASILRFINRSPLALARCTPASPVRWVPCCRPMSPRRVSRSSFRLIPWVPGRWDCLDFGGFSRCALYRIHPQFCGSAIEGGARRYFRGVPDRIDVSHAHGGHRGTQLPASLAPTDGSREKISETLKSGCLCNGTKQLVPDRTTKIVSKIE